MQIKSHFRQIFAVEPVQVHAFLAQNPTWPSMSTGSVAPGWRQAVPRKRLRCRTFPLSYLVESE